MNFEMGLYRTSQTTTIITKKSRISTGFIFF